MSEEAVGGLTDRVVIQLYVVRELQVHPRVEHHTSISIPLVIPTKDYEELIPRRIAILGDNSISPIQSDIVDRTNRCNPDVH
jgi:hypothetical protein